MVCRGGVLTTAGDIDSAVTGSVQSHRPLDAREHRTTVKPVAERPMINKCDGSSSSREARFMFNEPNETARSFLFEHTHARNLVSLCDRAGVNAATPSFGSAGLHYGLRLFFCDVCRYFTSIAFASYDLEPFSDPLSPSTVPTRFLFLRMGASFRGFSFIISRRRCVYLPPS